MFNLTRQERTVVLSLALVLLLGMSLDTIFKRNPQLRGTIAVLDNDTLYRRMDLNSVSYEEIVNCPHIGPSVAGRIIAYRKDKGVFHDLEELKAIPGIGKRHFKTISKYFKVCRP